MKYVKFKLICSVTGISGEIQEYNINGPVMPEIPGLFITIDGGRYGWYYGTSSDSFEGNPDNHLHIITKDQFIDVVNEQFAQIKADRLNLVEQNYPLVYNGLLYDGFEPEEIEAFLVPMKQTLITRINNFTVNTTTPELTMGRWNRVEFQNTDYKVSNYDVNYRDRFYHNLNNN